MLGSHTGVTTRLPSTFFSLSATFYGTFARGTFGGYSQRVHFDRMVATGLTVPFSQAASWNCQHIQYNRFLTYFIHEFCRIRIKKTLRRCVFYGNWFWLCDKTNKIIYVSVTQSCINWKSTERTSDKIYHRKGQMKRNPSLEMKIYQSYFSKENIK